MEKYRIFQCNVLPLLNTKSVRQAVQDKILIHRFWTKHLKSSQYKKGEDCLLLIKIKFAAKSVVRQFSSYHTARAKFQIQTL